MEVMTKEEILDDIKEYEDEGISVHKDTIMAHIVGKDIYDDETTKEEDKIAQEILDELEKERKIGQDPGFSGYVFLL